MATGEGLWSSFGDTEAGSDESEATPEEEEDDEEMLITPSHFSLTL